MFTALPSIKAVRPFTIAGNQAGILPEEFRFVGDRVYVRRDPRTGEVILSAEPHATWAEFIALRKELGPFPEHFLADRRQGT